MRRRPELMQLEMGMSTMRYLPASGTAGLARSFVSGNSRVPCPPPIMTESTLLVLIVCRPVCDIQKFLSLKKCLEASYTPLPKPARRSFTQAHFAHYRPFARQRVVNFCFFAPVIASDAIGCGGIF